MWKDADEEVVLGVGDAGKDGGDYGPANENFGDRRILEA